MVFRSADRSATLRVNTSRPGGDLVTALVEEESRTRLPGYQRIAIERLPTPFGGPGRPDAPGATWQYTYRDRDLGRMRGVDRVVVAGAATYRLQWRTPVRSWAKELSRLDVVVRTFQPARGTPARS